MQKQVAPSGGAALSSECLPDRRHFLGGTLMSGLAAYLALGATNQLRSDEPPLNPQAIRLNVEQRMQLVDQISSIIDKGGKPAQRIEQMKELAPIIQSYRDSFKGASDLEVQELGKVVDLVKLKINMPHFSDSIPKEISAEFINQMALDFYREILHELQAKRQNSNSLDEARIENLIGSVRNDLMWSQYFSNPVIAAKVGAVVNHSLIQNDDRLSISSINALLHFDRNQTSYYQSLLSGADTKIAELISQQVKEIGAGTAPEPKLAFEALLDLAHTIHQLARPQSQTPSDAHRPSDKELTKLEQAISKPVLENLIPFWCISNRAFHSKGNIVNFGGIIDLVVKPDSKSRSPYPLPGCQVLAGKIRTFCESYPDIRIEIGKVLIQSYEKARSEKLLDELDPLDLARLLATIPTPPESKVDLVSRLRVQIFSPSETPSPENPVIDEKPSIERASSIIRNLLLSDHCYAAAKENTAFDSRQALSIFDSALKRSDMIAATSTSLTPAQYLLLELSMANDYESQGLLNTQAQHTIRERSEKIVVAVIRNIYALGNRDIYSANREEALSAVNFSENSCSYTALPPDPDRKVQFCSAIRDLVTHADLLSAQLARFSITEPTERKLIDRLILLTNLIEERGSRRGINGRIQSGIEEQIKERFPYLCEEAATGPFVHGYHTIRNLLYLKNFNRLAPWEIPADTVEGARLRDKKLDQQALELANSAEVSFLAAFSLELIQPTASREDRPIEMLTVLSEKRAAVEVGAILASFGLLDNHANLRRIFEGKSEEISKRLLELRNDEVLRQQNWLEKMNAEQQKKSDK